MPPCLNRSQVEMLIKSRGDLSDQQLHEMMKSRQVFQAQSGLIRDLSRAKKSIHHDERIMLANLHWQKNMFLKKIDAREKSMRCLVSFKIKLGNTGPDSSECEDEKRGHIEKGGKEELVEDRSKGHGIKLKTDSPTGDMFTENRVHRVDKSKKPLLTTNEEWMTRASESPGRITSKEKCAKEKLTKKDSFSKYYEVTEEMFPNEPNAHHHGHDTGKPRERKSPGIEGEELNVRGAQLKSKKTQHLSSFRSLSSSSFKLPSSIKSSISSHSCNVRKPHQLSAPHRKSRNPRVHKETQDTSRLLQKPNREKTITMLFIERDDRCNWPSVSPFDIDAWLEQNRQKRGHTVVVSTTCLNGSDHPLVSRFHDEEAKVRKPSMPLRKPIQQRPLRFRLAHDRYGNIRKKGNDWFTSFFADKRKDSNSRQTQNYNMKDVKLLSDIHGRNTNLYGRKVLLPPICNHSIKCKCNTKMPSGTTL